MTPIMSTLELNRAAKQALIDALGFDGMIRFVRQFEPGSGDYTKDRHQWLDKITPEEFFAQMEQASASITDEPLNE
jgi:hypothetical protein